MTATNYVRKGTRFTWNTWKWKVLRKSAKHEGEKTFICSRIDADGKDFPETPFTEGAIRDAREKA